MGTRSKNPRDTLTAVILEYLSDGLERDSADIQDTLRAKNIVVDKNVLRNTLWNLKKKGRIFSRRAGRYALFELDRPLRIVVGGSTFAPTLIDLSLLYQRLLSEGYNPYMPLIVTDELIKTVEDIMALKGEANADGD